MYKCFSKGVISKLIYYFLKAVQGIVSYLEYKSDFSLAVVCSFTGETFDKWIASLLSFQGEQTDLAGNVIAIYSLNELRDCKKIIQGGAVDFKLSLYFFSTAWGLTSCYLRNRVWLFSVNNQVKYTIIHIQDEGKSSLAGWLKFFHLSF